jgi:hypothetical protein
MLDLYIRLKTFPNLLLFLLLSFGCVFWVYLSMKKHKRLNLIPIVIISALLLVLWGSSVGIESDETNHLHCAWMIHSGMVPFKDFWAHHSPLFWLILAPVFSVLKPTASIFELSRIFSAIIFLAITLIGWKIARKVWLEDAALSKYLLMIFGSSILGQFLWLRPDLIMNVFLLLCVYFCLDIPQDKKSASFFAGTAFGLAASFLFKQYLLFLLPIIIILGDRKGRRLIKLCFYFLGLGVGILPLLLYLAKYNIIREFIYWVFHYNRQRLIFSVVFPVGIFCLGTLGAYLLLLRSRKHKDNKALILFMAFCLSSISSITGINMFSYSGFYFLGFWFVLCAITGCGVGFLDIPQMFLSLKHKAIVAGMILSLIFLPNIFSVLALKKNYFSADKKIITQLMQYCAYGPCFTILPYHPIFSYDVARLYSNWQFRYSDDFPEIRNQIKNLGVYERISRLRPAVVMCSLNRRDFLVEIFQKSLISKDDYENLASFLEENYTAKGIGENRYYIRNDLL